MIGIYGGTFDPVHYGHLRTALEVQELFGLRQVRLIPCLQPPHREQPSVSAERRLRMLQMAVADEPALVIDERELQRGGPSYMVDTLCSLRADFDAIPLLLFIGSDAFQFISSWHRWRHLFDYAHIVVINRPGSDAAASIGEPFLQSRVCVAKQDLEKQPGGCLFFQNVTQLDISATQIRRAIIEKRNPRFLLPDSVLAYIRRNKLYLP